MTSRRFLGIDYGTKRIGLALSDEGGMLAFPKIIIANNPEMFREIGAIIKTENVQEIVVGESTDFSGKPNPVQAKIKNFAEALRKKFDIPVCWQKEFWTSVEGRRYQKNQQTDASAAALILQRYLDKINLL